METKQRRNWCRRDITPVLPIAGQKFFRLWIFFVVFQNLYWFIPIFLAEPLCSGEAVIGEHQSRGHLTILRHRIFETTHVPYWRPTNIGQRHIKFIRHGALDLYSRPNEIWTPINLLNPTGYVMHQQFNIQQLYALHLCVLYLSENKQRLVPLTA